MDALKEELIKKGVAEKNSVKVLDRAAVSFFIHDIALFKSTFLFI